MNFNLIDKVESAAPAKLVAYKHVSLAEEYLADHFPTFPVLPGVMMLEAMTQAAAWVMHLRTDFACSMAVLKEAKNVKYGAFVSPGQALRIEAEWIGGDEKSAKFKAFGVVEAPGTEGEQPAVSARLEIAYFNLADRKPGMGDVDRRLIEHHRARWALIAPQNTAAGI